MRWAIQRKTITIPKSVHAERIKENINIFDFSLSKVEMESIDKLNRNVNKLLNIEINLHLLNSQANIHNFTTILFANNKLR